MRQIEQQLLEAIAQQRNFRKSNTVYILDPAGGSTPRIGNVYLFGNHIAAYMRQPPFITITNCGYATSTTQSRLNALLARFCLFCAGVTRRNGGRLHIGWIENSPIIDLPMGRQLWYTLPAFDPSTPHIDGYTRYVRHDDIEETLRLLPPAEFKATPHPFGVSITSTPFNPNQYLEDLRNLGRVPEPVRMDRPSPVLLRPGIGSVWDRYRRAGA